MKITVLGAGLVGSAIVKDLAAEFEVTAVDINQTALDALQTAQPITTAQADLQDSDQIQVHIKNADLVISAVPGFMGYETLKTIVAAGKNVVDISFFGEDPFSLDDLAKQNGVTAVVDCGVAPGLSNILGGYVYDKLDECERYSCYVGGLPQVRQWPFEYKAVFSPSDVIEEYVRPARLVEHGREVIRPALSEIELLDFPGVGTLEAFNTDGLRSLVHTLDIPFMKEKTLRYPGHANLMRSFRETGLFNTETLSVKGQTVRPLDVTSALMFEKWRMGPSDTDFTVMLVEIEGTQSGKRVKYSYYLLDRFDLDSQTPSMSRTTGYTCTIVARQVLNGLFDRKGICPPEWLGQTPGCFEDLLAGYQQRNIHLKETISQMN